MTDIKLDDVFDKNFLDYSFDIAADIVLGLVLGTIVNVSADFVGKLLKLPSFGVLIIQFIFICVVLYTLKIDSKHLYQTWEGKTNYGIIFTAVFLASQKNIISFFENIYDEEKGAIVFTKPSTS